MIQVRANNLGLCSTKGNQQGKLIHNFSIRSYEADNLLTNNAAPPERLVDIKNNINYLHFLGGFFEGEGSSSVSIVVNKNFKFGINLQPVFNVTQHKNGLNILYSFKTLFGAGSVLKKSGSEDIWVYTIKGYKHIIKEVLPFLDNYVQPFSCKKEEYILFRELVLRSEKGYQKNKASLIEMVKLAYSLSGKGKGRKRALSEILDLIENKEYYFKRDKVLNEYISNEI